MDKIKLFSLIACICITLLCLIPSKKPCAFLMSAFPFLSLFIAQYIIYLTEHRSKVTRIFACFISIIIFIGCILTVLSMQNLIDLHFLVSQICDNHFVLDQVRAISAGLIPSSKTIIFLFLVLVALLVVWYQMFKKINIKILYASIGLVLCTNLLINDTFIPIIKNNNSSKCFAEEIKTKYQLTNKNVFVINQPDKYKNLYGLSFYMENSFNNFEKSSPKMGYFISTIGDLTRIQEQYKLKYSFEPVQSSENWIWEVKDYIVLSKIKAK